MGMNQIKWVFFSCLLALAGCASGPTSKAKLEYGEAAYQLIPAASQSSALPDYHIGPLDKLDVVVFQEPELSGRGLEVNAAGNISLSLIGDIAAVGKTGPELAAIIAKRYGARYLEHPQVSVTVAQSVSQRIVIQGEVASPGVYEIKGRATLLEAISLAKGETRVAAMKEVAVFRTVDGQRMGALFNVASIRRGEAQDPQLLGNDTIIVGLSRSKNAWRDVLASAPFFALFRPLGL
jgi:polysaccharide export outer membrane protein